VKRHKVWTSVLAVLALLIAAGVAGGGGDDGEDKAKSPAGSVGTDSPSPEANATPTPTPTPTPTVTPGPGSVLALLATLPVKGRAPKTGYSREAFDQAWADTDRNGCDTRIICTVRRGTA